MLHLPFCNVNAIPFDCAVVYRPRAGETAVTFFTKKLDAEGIRLGCPVGKRIGSAEEEWRQTVEQRVVA